MLRSLCHVWYKNTETAVIWPTKRCKAACWRTVQEMQGSVAWQTSSHATSITQWQTLAEDRSIWRELSVTMQWKDSPRFRTTTHSTILSTDQAYSSSIKIIPLLNKQVTTLSIVIVSIVMPSNFVTYFIEHCQYVPFKFPHSLYWAVGSSSSCCRNKLLQQSHGKWPSNSDSDEWSRLRRRQ